MNKQILFGQEAQEKLVEGARILHDAVVTTLGPRGRNVGIDLGYEPSIIHDGVKVAREIVLEDKAQDFAVRVLRQAANKQVQTVGDGTTVSIALAYAIYKECLKNIAAGENAMSLRLGLEKGRDLLLEELAKQAEKVTTKQQAIEIATISCADTTLGKQIGELVFELGTEGVITVEKSNGQETYVEKQEGMQFEKGYISPAFITDPERMEATVENAKLLLSDKNLVNIHEMLPLLEQFQKRNYRNLVIIAPEIADSALASAIITKQSNGMNVLCVKAPYAGQQQKDFLDDIALLTGGVVVSSETGRNFTEVTFDELGTAKRVTSTQDATLIVGGEGDKQDIKARVASLKELIKRDEGSDYQKEKLRERIGKLTNGIAVINVGGATEIEVNEKYERADDAVRATQAALKEGVVPGGETIYLKIRKVFNSHPDIAGRILYNALEQPFSHLLLNAGMKPDAYLDKVTLLEGVDVVKKRVVNLTKEGIIDPALVAKEALVNAISTAIALMTTEVLVIPKEEKDGKK